MRIRYLLLLAIFSLPACAGAQSNPLVPAQIFVGYSYLSNSINGVAGSHHPLNGWEAAAEFSEWHHLRFKLDATMYRGTNLGDPQNGYFVMGGGQYGATFHRERLYAEALVGEGGMSGTWFSTANSGYKNGNTGTTASLAEFLGGGIDTPIGQHTAFRVDGGVQHSYFVPIKPDSAGSVPYHLAGIPNYFGRLSAGIVWLPGSGSAVRQSPASGARTPVESELIFENVNSVGHMRIFVSSWWSNLYIGGIEYDRHSWGRFIGARLDYSAEIMPVIILRQPTVTDIWGNPKGAGRLNREIVPGVGILPIGARLLWRDGTRIKPYFVVKAGMTGFTKKAFSQYASYETFCLDSSFGMQFRLTASTDFRGGVGYMHQSNGFVVPSDPGLDEMFYSAGISYHLGRRQPAL